MGKFRHSLDPKRRLTIPADWRDQLAPENGMAVLPGMDKPCLQLLPAGEVKRRMRESIQGRSLNDPRSRLVARKLGSTGVMVEWDGQGRVRISDELLAEAGLEDEVIVVGALDVIELWNPARWEAEMKAEGAPTLGEAAGEIGF